MNKNLLSGIGFVIVAAACFATLDTATKFVSFALPFAAVMCARYAFHMLSLTAWLWLNKRPLAMHSKNLHLQIYRGALLTISGVLAFFSLKLIPVADFTSLMMLTPLIMTVVAATSMQERISPLRWMLLFLGFVGAIVVIRPGHEDFNWGSLIPLALVGTSTGFQLLTYRLAQVDEPLVTHWYTGCVGLVSTAVALPFVWEAGILSWQASGLGVGLTIALLCLIGMIATIGHGVLILGYAKAPVAVLTPYLYAQIPFAVFGGWLVFNHGLDFWSVAGIVVIAVSGVLGTWVAARERQADLRVVLDN